MHVSIWATRFLNTLYIISQQSLRLINEDKHIIEYVNWLSMHFTPAFSMRFVTLIAHSNFFKNSHYLPLGTVNSFGKIFKFNLLLCKLGARGYGKWNSLDCYYRSPLLYFIQTSATVWCLKYMDWYTDRQIANLTIILSLLVLPTKNTYKR